MINANIYKHKGQNFSNGGLSSRCDSVMVFGQYEAFDPKHAKSFLGGAQEAVRLCPGNVRGSVVARPIDPCSGKPLHGMAGGCMIATCDSRFGEMVAAIEPALRFSPIALHDRFE